LTDRVVQPEVDDDALVCRAKAGDRAAFGELARRHERRLYRFLAKAGSNAADVEDAMQQALVKAYVNLARYDARWKFTTWLFTIALRELRTIGRRGRAGPRVSALEDAGHLADRTGATAAHDALESKEDGAGLWDLARRVLTTPQYTALWLRFGEDLAPREVARVMRRPRVWVSVTLHRACAVLRKIAPGGEPGRTIEKEVDAGTSARAAAGGVT